MTLSIKVRGLIIDQGHILLTKLQNKKYFFLPGGSFNFDSIDLDSKQNINEKVTDKSVVDAIKRELVEEIKELVITDLQFAGYTEHTWVNDNSQTFHELSFIYFVSSNKSIHSKIESNEEKLEFSWIEMSKLSEYDLRPVEVLDFIKIHCK